MPRVFALLLVLVLAACGDDDSGGAGTAVSGSGGSGATGGSSGVGGTGGSGGASGSAGSSGVGGTSGSGGTSGNGGVGASDAAIGCPSQVPADQTPCATQGLLCFYTGGALVDLCMECTEWPCSEQVSECNGQHFAHIDRSSCDAGVDDAATLDAMADAASMGSDAGVDATVIDASGVDGSVVDAGGVGCRSGHYVGSMNGTYTSVAWGNGETPLTLQTESSSGAAGLDLWLAPGTTPCAPGAEFCGDLEVTMGVAHLVLPMVGLSFDAAVTGALDCTTGEFRGDIVANVILFSLSFSGPMRASYDSANSALTQGTWSVTDNASSQCPTCGGSGTWSAMWVDTPWNDDDAGVDVDAAIGSDAGTPSTVCAGTEICRTSPAAMTYLSPGQGFCAPDNNAPLPPACTTANTACGPSGGTCVNVYSYLLCLRVCDLPN